MAARKKALIRSGGKPPGGSGAMTTDVLPPGDAPPQHFDDLANSQLFLDLIGEDLLYCAEQQVWYIWEKTHWAADRKDFVFKLAKQFARSLYDEPGGNDQKSSVYKNAQRANNSAGFNAFLGLAMREVTVSIEDLDDPKTTKHLINCLNGTLDLKTGALRDHDRLDRITRIVNCNYNADAISTAFDKFLQKIQPDASIRAFLQRSIGYSLLGNVRERSFWILYGSGNNGKSVFTNLFINLLGDYASTTPASSIMASKQSAIPNDIARLKGKRFIVVPETEENERLQASLVKALSAGDKVSARFLFGEFFDFYFSGKLWIATNHKPTITDHSKGFWDRCKLVPFNVDIPADEVDRDIMSKLMADAEAVLLWAVQGCRDYFEADGLDVPDVIQAEIDAYRKEQDSIAQFLEEKCQTRDQAAAISPDRYFTDAEFRVSNGDLYDAYKKFCNENGEYLRSHRRFSQNMAERQFKQMRGSSRYWEGLRLNDAAAA